MWGKTLPLRELLGLVGRFPGKTTPAALPDITEHNNCMTDFFKKNPGATIFVFYSDALQFRWSTASLNHADAKTFRTQFLSFRFQVGL